MPQKLSKGLKIDEQEKQLLVEELHLGKAGAVQSAQAVAAAMVPVTVRPADSMDRQRVVASGTAREVRSRTITAQLMHPVAIGSFYELKLEDVELDAPVTFGRCDQITMLAEDVFEVRFRLLEPLIVPEKPRGQQG